MPSVKTMPTRKKPAAKRRKKTSPEAVSVRSGASASVSVNASPAVPSAALPGALPAAADRRARRFLERDARILDVAHRRIAAEGFSALSMEAIASEIDYSKGTVYQHYRSKEDILVALAVRTARKRWELFEQGAAFRGRPRERMAALGEAYAVFVREYPNHFRVEQEIHAARVRSRAEVERQLELRSCEDACKHLVTGIIRDGIAQGDLVLPPGVEIMDLSFSLWSITFGAFFLMSGDVELEKRGVARPHESLRRACNALLDGWGWRPLWGEWDYAKTYRRIRRDVFPEHGRG